MGILKKGMRPLDSMDVAVLAAKRAAGKIFALSERKSLTTRKDFLTSADLESHQAIKEVLLKHFPNIPLYSEEGGEKKAPSGFQWVVDDLDGSWNYFLGCPDWGISIALVRDNCPCLGLIYIPSFKRFILTDEEGPSGGSDGMVEVNKEKDLSESSVIVEWAKERDGNERYKVAEILRRVAGKSRYPRAINSSVAALAMVATGRAMAMVHLRPEPFDVAAGALIVQRAGGVVTDLLGNPWSPFEVEKGFVASNGYIHEQLLKVINS